MSSLSPTTFLPPETHLGRCLSLRVLLLPGKIHRIPPYRGGCGHHHGAVVEPVRRGWELTPRICHIRPSGRQSMTFPARRGIHQSLSMIGEPRPQAVLSAVTEIGGYDCCRAPEGVPPHQVLWAAPALGPWSYLHRHAFEQRGHWGSVYMFTTAGCWISTRLACSSRPAGSSAGRAPGMMISASWSTSSRVGGK